MADPEDKPFFCTKEDIADYGIIAAVSFARIRLKNPAGKWAAHKDQIAADLVKEFGRGIIPHLVPILREGEKYFNERAASQLSDARTMEQAGGLAFRRIKRNREEWEKGVSGQDFSRLRPRPRSKVEPANASSSPEAVPIEKQEASKSRRRRVVVRHQPVYITSQMPVEVPAESPQSHSSPVPSPARPKRRFPWMYFWGALLFLAFLWFVWPTPYRYFKDGSDNMRVNRFTDKVQHLKYGGWSDP